MLPHKKHKPSCKVWIEYNGTPVLGKGGAEILRAIGTEHSILKAAEKLGMSYRYVWNYMQKIQKAIESPVAVTFKGGKSGGGGARLTELGQSLIEEYQRVEGRMSEVLADQEHWGVLGLKISARNQLKGKVVSIEEDGITAKVKVEIETPAVVTSVITK
ncbi:LysR family transcriptional regulator, partial [Candidatus Bathyarchaeota archaeon]